MLRYNAERLSSFLPLRADFLEGLPILDESIDLVVLTEALERLQFSSFLISSPWKRRNWDY